MLSKARCAVRRTRLPLLPKNGAPALHEPDHMIPKTHAVASVRSLHSPFAAPLLGASSGFATPIFYLYTYHNSLLFSTL